MTSLPTTMPSAHSIRSYALLVSTETPGTRHASAWMFFYPTSCSSFLHFLHGIPQLSPSLWGHPKPSHWKLQLPSLLHPTSLSWFILCNSSCCLLTYILLSIVEVLRAQGFLFLLYPQCLEQCLTHRRQQINIPKMNEERTKFS